MRILNRPLAFLLACALLTAVVIVIIEVVAAAINRGPAVVSWDSWYAWAGRTQFKAGVIRFWAIVLIVAGTGLLVLQLKPRRASRIATVSDDAATNAAITRRGLRSALITAATGIDGVSVATARVSGRRADLTCRAAGRDKETARTLVDPVRAAAQAKLDNLELRRPFKLAVRVTPRSS